ncbi:MAG: IS4 family transposase [Anaerolineae bacterium]|nr:IS4 family transposase [Anaerolineae bacterium]
MRLQGQTFGSVIIERIKTCLRENSQLTRSGLSREVCQWLDWRSANGKPREIDARKALLELERACLIELPAARFQPPQLRKATKEASLVEVQIEAALKEIGEVSLVAVSAKEPPLSQLWNRLLEDHHPLGSGPLCGAQQRYLIRSEHYGWVGCLAFSAAAWHMRERDTWIGWAPRTRRANLQKVVANSRFLLLPQVRVPHLASHVLGLAARTLVTDWQRRYGYVPVLLESFVDENDYAGTSYRAANWQRVGETSGRGRQDRYNACDAGRKAIYLLPLEKNWRQALCAASSRPLRLPPAQQEEDWAEYEFGRVDVADGRLRERLLILARDFYAQPLAPIPQACGGSSAKTKAAYRFLSNPNVDLDTLLEPHIAATAKRMQAHPVVLSVQDTTSLNYQTHLATYGLGPINTHADGAQGLRLHDTLAYTPDGVPLGIIDAECWARDAIADTQSNTSRRRRVEETEALRWITSYVQSARLQALLPETRVVSVADREADIYELFEKAQQTPNGPDLLIRANRSRRRRVKAEDETHLLWEYMEMQADAGVMELHIPGKGGRKARTADLTIRHSQVTLQAPRGQQGKAITLWAVQAIESAPPEGFDAVEWLLLTTVAVADFTQACERLSWYAVRWSIEIFHRTLKSGCRIEDRRLAEAGNLQACLALDMVVAWRVLYLTHLGRRTPDLPCSIFFEEEEWKALSAYHHRQSTPPEEEPTLGTAMRMVAKIGGFLGRKGDGNPGATVLWRGLDKLGFITDTFRLFHPALPNGP